MSDYDRHYLEPDDTEDYILYDQGRQLMGRGRLDAAIDCFERSFQLCHHMKTAEMIGECCYQMGDKRKSVLYFAAATSLGRSSRPPRRLAEVLLELDDFHQAREMARLAISRNKDEKRAEVVLERATNMLERTEPDIDASGGSY